MHAPPHAKTGGIRGWVIFAALGLGAGAALFAWMLLGRGGAAEEVAATSDEDDEAFDFSGAVPRDRASVSGVASAPAEGPLARIPERIRAQIQLTALGARGPTFTEEQIVATLQENRRPLRECLRQAGGFRALRSSAAPDGGAAGPLARPRMGFDVGPDGRVVSGSVALEPAGPEGLSACVANVLAAASFPPPGGDGAHVELPLGLGRGGGRRRTDGGVASERPRGERGDGRPGNARPGGEGRAAGSATVPAIAPP